MRIRKMPRAIPTQPELWPAPGVNRQLHPGHRCPHAVCELRPTFRREYLS